MRPKAFAEVFYSVLIKRSSFKGLLKVYYRSVFAESFNTFIFQEFSTAIVPQTKSTKLCSSAAVVPQSKSTELCNSAAVVPQSKSTGMWSSAAPFQHDLWYFWHRTNEHFRSMLFRKTYKQPTVTPLKSLKSTHLTKLLHLLRWTIRYHQPSRLFHNDTQFK